MKFIVFMTTLCLNYSLNAQTHYKSLLIGDEVPDIEFNNMLNYPGGKARLSDFKGKLVILDFWNIGCTPCIAGFPKMQKIQEQFKNKVQVLLVNIINDRKSLDKRGFPGKTYSNILNNVKLPFVLLDDNDSLFETKMDQLFDHGNEPYHVWISEDGRVLATTSGTGTTPGEIEKYFSGKQIEVMTKPNLSDMGLAWRDTTNEYKSILQPKSKIVFDNIMYSSFIARNLAVKGLAGPLFDSVSKKLVGIRISGDLLHLFKTTFRNSMSYTHISDYPDRVVLEINNPSDYIEDPSNNLEQKAKWEAKNIYTYELKLPAERMPSDIGKRSELINSIMRQDLERFFGVKATIENRTVHCRALVRMTKEDKLVSDGGEPEFLNEEGEISMNNYSLSAFIMILRQNAVSPNVMPLLDETGYSSSKSVDMKITTKLHDIAGLKRELKKYGLDIIEVERELQVLVIKTDK